MKTKVSIAILFVFALTAIFIKQQTTYPQRWDKIQIGMTKEEISDLLGEPQQYWGEKGAFWGNNKITQRQELNIRFEANEASHITITESIGTNKDFVRYYPRVENK